VQSSLSNNFETAARRILTVAPFTDLQELGERDRMKGIDTALGHCQNLKKNHAEKGAYDFSERSLKRITSHFSKIRGEWKIVNKLLSTKL
jgi:hypothetical protein